SALKTNSFAQMTSKRPVVAVLFQALAPPVYDGVSKPPKPGGYRDSGADVAYALYQSGMKVVTPDDLTDPSNQDHWCFPDTEAGILAAVQKDATHLWANTVLFKDHPLQTSSLLTPYENSIKVVGQPPLCADIFDDKSFVNDKLCRYGGFTLPRSWTVNDLQSSEQSGTVPTQTCDDILSSIREEDYPIVAKPVRGRGSHGVKICKNAADLADHIAFLFKESPRVLLEEYLAGEEGTITVMPPSQHLASFSGTDSQERYAHHWALPPVIRFNHVDGIAPYSGKVAVTVNSRAISSAEMETDAAYAAIMKECETVATLLQTTAPIRIDIRRFGPKSKFALFDINMKPNITGPGRPGRDDQLCLMGIAAESIGWDYLKFLEYVLYSTGDLVDLRKYSSPLLV
ncbi:hypothetical protein N7495_004390, partial [Penicillium taxi]|uniref:uncharacterized protein n=1 Tax=Penicillium taxi TaxID=168475 RepID=UPI0025458B01